ncbi:MAG: 3-hydroxyacyl-CoA dehydrogenase family protein [Desulfovibrio sp.]|jgi:3-hydroxybutyryl-CoA dehydrogenase|nr:3-hydroxyacyl-CoA dehydrogenase family protein [Desulfovibrio sp.]
MHVKAIKKIACLGTGTMGHGVAFLAAKAGYEVKMFGRSSESIKRGLDGVDRASVLYEDNGLLPKGSKEKIKAAIKGCTSVEEAVHDVDLVMESVAENLKVKQEVFSVVERNCPEGALVATDTSGLNLEDIRTVLKRPEQFMAIHFFTPPYLMPTVEVCPCSATLQSALDLGAQWVESLGNVPIVMAKAVSGFLINRIQTAVLREATYIVEQGWASAETVDKAIALSLGRRYSVTGPIESADMGGWDILGALLDELGDKLSAAKKASPIVNELRDKGNLGLKTGQGVYAWTPERIASRRSARELSLIKFLREDQEAAGKGK